MKNRIFGSAVALLAAANLLVAGGIASATSTDYVPELVYTIDPDGINDYDGTIIFNMASFGDKLAFETNDGVMYTTDGTEAGTVDLSDALEAADVTDVVIERDARDSYSLDVNGELLFWGYVDEAIDNDHWELFTTDGTTVDQVTDGLNGDGQLYYLDGELYVANTNTDEFVTVDLASGDVDVIEGDYDCNIYYGSSSAVAVNGKILFHWDDDSCDDQIAVWNPATPNIAPITLEPSLDGLGETSADDDYLDYNEYINFYVFDGKAYFSAYGNDENDSSIGVELFATDGTQGGTERVKDINVGLDDSDPGSRSEMSFTEFNGELYFSAYNGTEDLMYKTDGSAAGTVVVDLGEPVNPGENSEGTAPIVNGKMITSLDVGNGDDWASTDGTEIGTEFLIDDDSVDSNACWEECALPVLFDDHAFFLGYDGEVNAIWVTDGTQAGTEKVTDSTFSISEHAISDSAEDAPLVVAGDNLYFALSDWEGTGASALYKISASGLAETGTDAGASLWAGLGLLVAGATVVTVRRRIVK